MRIGLAQIDCELGQVEKNLRTMVESIGQARSEGVDLLVFPELCVTGYSLGEVREKVSMATDDPRLQSLLDAAGDMDVVFGFQEDGELRTYNSAAYCAHGEMVHVHRKLYLPTYAAFEERKHFSPGQHMRAFSTDHGRAAMLICNDAWQPVTPFIGVQDGARILIVPTNSANSRFPGSVDNMKYWKDITRFYGRVYESIVIFVNRVGVEGEFHFWGGSHVVGPNGNMLALAPQYEASLTTVDVDVRDVDEWRRTVPLVKEARLALLSRELDRLAQSGGDL